MLQIFTSGSTNQRNSLLVVPFSLLRRSTAL